ncbi:unnamed protein product [Prorocentrum cordatum]|uniref:Uncharacterized protein n=1 Tax=Prorocentrum cordatum TaxID=2364126 RepID=A0ABN9RQB3_9DINO|nr:unnamed protein product [Polarella glacialis]
MQESLLLCKGHDVGGLGPVCRHLSGAASLSHCLASWPSREGSGSEAGPGEGVETRDLQEPPWRNEHDVGGDPGSRRRLRGEDLQKEDEAEREEEVGLQEAAEEELQEELEEELLHSAGSAEEELEEAAAEAAEAAEEAEEAEARVSGVSDGTGEDELHEAAAEAAELAEAMQEAARSTEAEAEAAVEDEAEAEAEDEDEAEAEAEASEPQGAGEGRGGHEALSGGRHLCEDDEELHIKACYKRCDLLTGGEYPYRTTAWSCCKEKRCNFLDHSMMKADLRPCDGLDVSGDSREPDAKGRRCPFAVGTCDDDEVQHHGLCFKVQRALSGSLRGHQRVRLPRAPLTGARAVQPELDRAVDAKLLFEFAATALRRGTEVQRPFDSTSGWAGQQGRQAIAEAGTAMSKLRHEDATWPERPPLANRSGAV